MSDEYVVHYRDRSHRQGLTFPYDIIVSDRNENAWGDINVHNQIKARRNSQILIARKAFGMPGKLWTYEHKSDNDYGYGVTYSFRDKAQAMWFKLQL